MTDKPVVRPASEMDNVAFARHYNIRHPDGLGELFHGDEHAIGIARAYHGRLHTEGGQNHTHRAGQPDQQWQDGTPTEESK